MNSWGPKGCSYGCMNSTATEVFIRVFIRAFFWGSFFCSSWTWDVSRRSDVPPCLHGKMRISRSGRSARDRALRVFLGAPSCGVVAGGLILQRCKRIFSLMNDLKTAERSKLGNATLKNLMTWHVLGKQVKCEQLPVMSILKEFRDMAGGKGRKPHKPSEPPVYDYQLAS